MKAADVRFYMDADVLGLGKVIASLRPDVTYPGDPGAVIHKRQRPPCAITSPKAKDADWIPVVSQQGLVVITRDTKIQQHHAEKQAVMENAGRLIALSSAEAATVWSQLEVVMTQWRRIEALAEAPGPWVYSATRSSLKKVA